MEISEFRKVEKMPKMYIFCQVQWQDHDWAKRTYNTKFYANQEQELKQIIKKTQVFFCSSAPGGFGSNKKLFSQSKPFANYVFFQERSAKCKV